MAIQIDTFRRSGHATPAEQIASTTVSTPAAAGGESKGDSDAVSLRKEGRSKSILLNVGLIAACLIGLTVISVGSAALTAIDGLATIKSPEVLSKVPLAIVLMVSTVSGAGIVYLMVQVLLAMADDVDHGDYR